MSYTENININDYIEQELSLPSRDESPIAVLIAGQPGAGKGTIERYLSHELNHNVITIDPDEMRRYHPDQERLQKENDKTAADYTHKDVSRWATKLRDVAIENKRNIIIDGTLKSPDKAKNLCEMLKENGYRIEVHAVAVNELQSKLGIVARYESAKNKSGHGRWVPEAIHDDAYKGGLKSLAMIEEQKLVDAVFVHSREDKNLYENRLDKKGEYSQTQPHAAEKVMQQREKPFSKEIKDGINNSIDKTKYLMDKRSAPQEDKNYLSDLASKIDKKIMKDQMRLNFKDALQKINNMEKQSIQIEKKTAIKKMKL